MINKHLPSIAVAAGIMFSATAAYAEENLWTYAKGTDTRPKGSWEFRIQDIIRYDKNSGDYLFHDIQPAIEYGYDDKLTIGLQLMFFHHDYSVEDSELNPMYDTQGGDGSSFKDTQYAGYELDMKYNVLSPYKDYLGFSWGLGFEHRDVYRLDGAPIDQNSLETYIYLQKNYLDDKLVLVFNFKTEFEKRTPVKEDAVMEEFVIEDEVAFDMSLAASYRVAPKHFVGLELRRQEDHLDPYTCAKDTGCAYDNTGAQQPSDFAGLIPEKLGSRYQYGVYFGPTYHYAEASYWITAGVMQQVRGGCSSVNPNCSDNKNWDEHEKYHFNIAYGYEF